MSHERMRTMRPTSSTLRSLTAAALLAGLALGVTSCGNDDGGPIPDAGPADAGACTPLPTTYSAVHEQILSTASCARSGCHDTATVASGGGNGLDLSLDKAAVLEALLVTGTNAVDVKADLPHRVVASDLTNSFLWRKVHDDDPPGFGARMPLGCSARFPGSCLTQCQLDALEGWISAGAMDD